MGGLASKVGEPAMPKASGQKRGCSRNPRAVGALQENFDSRLREKRLLRLQRRIGRVRFILELSGVPKSVDP